jgi:hypothetical protein
MGFPGLTGDRRGPLEGKWRGPLAGIRAGGFQPLPADPGRHLPIGAERAWRPAPQPASPRRDAYAFDMAPG